MKQPLAGLELWLTRPANELGPSLQRFREAGAQAEGLPLVRRVDIVPARDELEALPAAATVVLSSAHAARRWRECIVALPSLADRPVAVVGERAAARLHDLEPGVVLRAPTAAALLAKLPGRGPFVLAGSRARRPELPDGLRDRGAEVVELDLYGVGTDEEVAGLARERWATARPHAVAFYSPSAVDAFSSLGLAAGPPVAALAIGPTTAGRLGPWAAGEVVVADPPGEEALVAATARWWAGRA